MKFARGEEKRLRARAERFKALGHPARLMMLDMMGAGEQCVCDLAECVGLDMSTVSRHLNILRSARLVTVEKRGTWHFYRLACCDAQGLFQCLDQLASDDIGLQRKRRSTPMTNRSKRPRATSPSRGS